MIHDHKNSEISSHEPEQITSPWIFDSTNPAKCEPERQILQRDCAPKGLLFVSLFTVNP